VEATTNREVMCKKCGWNGFQERFYVICGHQTAYLFGPRMILIQTLMILQNELHTV
jgi:hypothetical protein